LKTDSSVSTEKRLLIASFHQFDIPVLIDEMKHESTIRNDDLNARVFSKKHNNQVVLTVLQKDSSIKSFQPNDAMSIYLVEGKMRFFLPKKSITLSKGQLLVLNENVNYRLKAIEESSFLLFVSNINLKSDADEIPWFF
jgi:quercetin dioxygenase-like cupin family protein